MAGRGKSRKLKVLNGNPSGRPLRNEAVPRPQAPKIPAELDREARKTWRELGPKLEKLGLLTELDGNSFAALCVIRSRLIQIGKNISACKDVGEFKSLTRSERQYLTLFRSYAAEFGLCPRGRIGLAVNWSDFKKDDGSELLTHGSDLI